MSLKFPLHPPSLPLSLLASSGQDRLDRPRRRRSSHQIVAQRRRRQLAAGEPSSSSRPHPSIRSRRCLVFYRRRPVRLSAARANRRAPTVCLLPVAVVVRSRRPQLSTSIGCGWASSLPRRPAAPAPPWRRWTSRDSVCRRGGTSSSASSAPPRRTTSGSSSSSVTGWSGCAEHDADRFEWEEAYLHPS